jgi:hypothetical protein
MGFPVIPLAKAKQGNRHHVGIVLGQISKCFGVTIFLRVEAILSALARRDGLFQVLFVACHLRMVQRRGDVVPSLLRQVDGMARLIANGPTPASRHEHPIAGDSHKPIMSIPD